MKTVLIIFGFLLLYATNLPNRRNVEAVTEFKNKIFHFPYGSPYMGFLTAFALPLKVATPGDVFIAVNFEASYNLPTNQTTLFYPPLAQTTRQILYNLFEAKFDSHGYPGKSCLLRTICEAAELSTNNTGLFGDLVHILLTPSTSLNGNLSIEYSAAEAQATKKGKCKKYKRKCSFSILNMFTWMKNILASN